MGQGRRDEFHLGFLAAIELEGRGYVGGLLVTNHLGRPLEFQCTTPVRPNRTQEILYGPTLRAYVVGELIGATLVERTGVKPHLLIVETEEQLGVAEHVSLPVARLVGEHDPVAPGETLRVGRQLLRCVPGADVAGLSKQSVAVPAEADLAEPFERVREALRETMRAAA